MTDPTTTSLTTTFSRRIKDELCRIVCDRECCARTEVSTAFMAAGRSMRDRLVMTTSHSESAVRLIGLIRSELGIEPEIQAGRELITINIRKNLAAGPVGWVTGKDDCRDDEASWPLCCRQAFVRSLFLFSGSVSEPSSAYHMEFSIRHPAAAERIRARLDQLDIRTTMSRRIHQSVLYVQEGQNMADFLLLAGAHQSLLAFESLRVEKEMRNSVNRVVNCDSANTQRLANAAARGVCEVFYWRDRNREVDFVVRAGRALVAIEVKSGRRTDTLPGTGAFAEAFRPTRTLLVGADGIPLEEFLLQPVEHWVAP